MSEIRVLIVDDHVLVRQGLRLLLDEMPGIRVVGEGASGDDAVLLAQRLQPDAVLLDVHMPKGLDGITAARHIRGTCPQIRVIMLTMFDDDVHVEKMLLAGVSGVLFKHDDSAEIIEAIRSGTPSRPYLPRRMSEENRERLVAQAARPDEPSLTARETEVLIYLANGYTNKEVATKLMISVKTVETHRANIMKRLQLQTRFELVDYALKNGYMEAPKSH